MIIGRIQSSQQGHYTLWVEGIVELPRLGVKETVLFLVDTGATDTTIHPADAQKLGIDFNLLTGGDKSYGIGGASKMFREKASLLFQDSETLSWHPYELEINIADATEYNQGFPSLLGSDVLSCWYMESDPTNGLLQFTVRRTLSAP